MKKWTKNILLTSDSVGEIVSQRTGMDNKTLLSDKTEYAVNGLHDAVDLFWKHVMRGSMVRVYADYDADGINSAAIFDVLFSALKIRNGVITVPCRFSDGYGVKESNVRNMTGGLLITVDNGIAAHDAVATAKKNGVDVIILDHHEARTDGGRQVIPEADVIVDPHVTGADFTDYCGAGLAFRFAEEVFKTKPHRLTEKAQKYLLSVMNCFAAIGTVADAVPLTWDNRKIVKRGCWLMEHDYCSMGLKLLLEQLYLHGHVNSGDIAFLLGPTVNAYGRLEDKGARKVFRALSYNGKFSTDIKNSVAELILKNKERKSISACALDRALGIIKNSGMQDDNFLVVYDKDNMPGIAGLTAGNLTEKFSVPSIVFCPTSDPDIIKGSGRSVDWAVLTDSDGNGILDSCKDLIHVYGGHAMACGISIRKENLDAFRKAVNDACLKLDRPEPDDSLHYDVQITVDDIPDIMADLKTYGPFGQNNPEIVFRIDNVGLVPGETGKYGTMGETGEHLKLYAKNMELVWFDGTSLYRNMGEPNRVSVIGVLSEHWFKNRCTPQLQILDLISAEEDTVGTLKDRLKEL